MEQEFVAFEDSLDKIGHSEHKVKYHSIITTLASLLVVPLYLYGVRILVILSACIATAVLIDLLCIRVFFRERRLKYDYSSVVTAMVTTMLMPATVPIIIPCFSVFLALCVAKYPFGGVSYNIFNPACVGVAFCTLSWPEYVLKYPQTHSNIDIFDLSNVQYSDSPSSFLKIGGTPKLDYFDILLGDFVGPIGGTCIIVLLCCMFYLVVMNVIAKRVIIPAVFIVALFATVFPRVSTGAYDSLMYEFCSGGFLFGLIFMINDPTTKPQTKAGQIFYGFIFGLSVVFFKYFGAVELEVVYAVLMTNIFKHECDVRGNQIDFFVKGIFKPNQNIQPVFDSDEDDEVEEELEEEELQEHIFYDEAQTTAEIELEALAEVEPEPEFEFEAEPEPEISDELDKKLSVGSAIKMTDFENTDNNN